MNLRGTNYGVCYGTALDASGLTCKGDGATNNILSGWAWGSDVGGWLNFGVLIPPVLNKVTSAPDGKSATLKWSNGMNYSSVEVWRSQPELYPACASNPIDLVNCRYKKLPPSDVSMGSGAISISPTMQSADKSSVVNNLTPGTTYGFFIRAYTQ